MRRSLSYLKLHLLQITAQIGNPGLNASSENHTTQNSVPNVLNGADCHGRVREFYNKYFILFLFISHLLFCISMYYLSTGPI
jgi:hypothetical protein